MAERPTRKEIFDALTCCSSKEGCDPDWRREVLDNADPKDRAYVEEKINAGGTRKEAKAQLKEKD